MKEVEIPKTYISGQADSVMMLTEDVPSERMLGGDMVLIRQLHNDSSKLKDGHLYAVRVYAINCNAGQRFIVACHERVNVCWFHVVFAVFARSQCYYE